MWRAIVQVGWCEDSHGRQFVSVSFVRLFFWVSGHAPCYSFHPYNVSRSEQKRKIRKFKIPSLIF